MDRKSMLLRIESVLGIDLADVNFNGSHTNSGFYSGFLPAVSGGSRQGLSPVIFVAGDYLRGAFTKATLAS